MKFGVLAVALLAITVGNSAIAKDVRLANVAWGKSGALNNADFGTQGLTDRTSRVVFIRPAGTQPNPESSTNISLNDRFLTSLQDGHYSAHTVCSVGTKISAYPTANKSNDLLANAQMAQLVPNQVQFYQVEVSAGFAPTLKAVDAATAKQLLQGTSRQAHQISRVDTTNCQVPAQAVQQPVRTPVRTAAPVVAPAVAQATPSLQLNILFDTDKSNIKPAYTSEIDRAAAFLANYPNMHAIIEGHTDSQGAAVYNQRLSQRRAEAVRTALINQHGVNANRLSAIGYGEDRPVADNATAQGRSDNRRVIVTIPQNQ